MLKKLICRWWGHKVVAKMETGQTYKVGQVVKPVLRPLKEFKVLPFCLRCGEPNEHVKQKQTTPEVP